MIAFWLAAIDGPIRALWPSTARAALRVQSNIHSQRERQES
jgi:hypothetical protein